MDPEAKTAKIELPAVAAELAVVAESAKPEYTFCQAPPVQTFR
jgi:hypothetical protein